MEAKEKAKELIEKYKGLSKKKCDCLEYTCSCFKIYDYQAKRCVLILVDEIINEYKTMNNTQSGIVIGEDYYTIADLIEWWQEVKKEIELL